jgi:ATP-dependent RNA helicase DeaD
MLVREIVSMAEAPAEEDLAAGRILLEQRTPEELAAMLVRSRRERLPAPEVLNDPGPDGNEASARRRHPGARRGWEKRDNQRNVHRNKGRSKRYRR